MTNQKPWRGRIGQSEDRIVSHRVPRLAVQAPGPARQADCDQAQQRLLIGHHGHHQTL